MYVAPASGAPATLRPRVGENEKKARAGSTSAPHKKKYRSASFNPQASVVMRRKGEAKSYDGAISGLVGSQGVMFSLYENYLTVPATKIAQGAGEEANYIGDTITPLYITIRGLFVHSDATNALRVIVFQTLGILVSMLLVL